jgi:hypothetical protein
MRRCRRFPFLLIAGGLALAAAALAHNPAPPEDAENPAAGHFLERAAAALAPERIAWLACDVHQRADLPGLHYSGEGKYQSGPGHRFRLEMHTNAAGAAGTLLLVSDGVNVWQARRAGRAAWEGVTRVRLGEVLAWLDSAGGATQLRAEFLQGPTLSGVVPLLRTLRYRLRWVAHEEARHEGAEAVVLTGVWRPNELRERAPAGRPWPPGLPRRCRVVLDARTLWPHRVEWWGPAGAAPGAEALLAVTEYRSPSANVALPPAECERAFAFDPGDARVTDRTGEVSADLAARLQEMAVAGR